MRTPFYVLIFSAVLLLAGCGDNAATDDLQVLHDGDGVVIKEVASNDLLGVIQNTGSDIVAVNLWASWCIPCLEEFPEFMEDVHAVAVPVRDYTRSLVGTLAVVGPAHRLTDEAINNEIAPVLHKAGTELSKRLGFPG